MVKLEHVRVNLPPPVNVTPTPLVDFTDMPKANYFVFFLCFAGKLIINLLVRSTLLFTA